MDLQMSGGSVVQSRLTSVTQGGKQGREIKRVSLKARAKRQDTRLPRFHCSSSPPPW